MAQTFFLKTFGCAQNTADSQRLKTYYHQKGYQEVKSWKKADLTIINTCIVRESAENRAYGLINNIHQHRLSSTTSFPKIILTGCLVGTAYHDKTGKKMRELKRRLPQVQKFLPIERISFQLAPLRDKKTAALIPISAGCNNFCSYCIVPYARGKEQSRPLKEIIKEVKQAIDQGFGEIVLVGQNVNSYGADLTPPSLTKSLNKTRQATLFHHLLETIATLPGVKDLSFVSSNPWDFSDQLIKVIAQNKNISRTLHLPVQSGDNRILKKMNRNYTAHQYLGLIKKIRKAVPNIQLTTDILIGFPGEDEKAFQNTVKLCKQVNFKTAYLNKYSPRPGTLSAHLYKDDVSSVQKHRRWHILERLINQKSVKIEAR